MIKSASKDIIMLLFQINHSVNPEKSNISQNMTDNNQK